MTMTFRTSENGIEHIALREGFEPKAYRVAGRGNWTIGFGQEGFLFPGTPGAIPVTPGLAIDRKLAKEALYHFVYNVVDPMVREHFNPQTQDEHDACSSFCYNVRHERVVLPENHPDAYTLPKLIRRADRSPAAVQAIIDMWMRYIHTPGAQNGLWKRRLGEVLMFLGLPWNAPAVMGYLESARYLDKDGRPNPNVTIDFLIDVAQSAKPIPSEPDPPKAPAPVQPVESAPLPEVPPVDPNLPPKKIEESKTGKAVNRASRGRETVTVGTIGTTAAIVASQVEIVGKTLESLQPSTLLLITAMGFVGLIGFGGYMWWSGRNEAYWRRLEQQDPKY